MFGKHWIAARGLIVDKRDVYVGGNGMVSLYEFVVEVTTASGEVFRAKADEPHIATNFKDPSIGDTVGVEYEEESRQVRFDKDDPQLSWKAWKKSRPSTFDESLHAAPGTPVGGSAGAASAGVDLEALRKVHGITGATGSSATSHVFRTDGSVPDAAALREALLAMLGEQPPASEEG